MKMRGVGIRQIKETINKGAKTLRSDGSLVAEYRWLKVAYREFRLQKIRKVYPCPCGGKLKWAKEKVIQDGIDCGILDIEICGKCGSKYFPEESMETIEDKLKEKGLWGSRKEIKFWKSGGSVVIRLPTEISKSMDLMKIKKGYIYPEGKRKIFIEF